MEYFYTILIYTINGRAEPKHSRPIGCCCVILAAPPIANRSKWAPSINQFCCCAHQRLRHVNDGITCRSRCTVMSFPVCRGTAQWFGVGEDCETKQQVWHRKSLRHCSQRYGKLKAQYREPEPTASMDQGLDSPAAHKLPRVRAPYSLLTHPSACYTESNKCGPRLAARGG